MTHIKEGRNRITNLFTSEDFGSTTISDFKNKLTKFDPDDVKKTKEIKELDNNLNHEVEIKKMTRETTLSLMDFDKI